jgi:hypothetical protein
VALGVSCEHSATSPLDAVKAERAKWAAHGLTRYAYVYEVTGFNLSIAGRPIRLVILNGTVNSAQDVATDSLLPVSAMFPTLDGLFDQAEAALAAGTLTAITLDFPSRLDLAGPADGSGSIFASGLQPLP